jgi:hypothetical protein
LEGECKNAYSRCCWSVRCSHWFYRDAGDKLVLPSHSSSSQRRVAACAARYHHRHGEHFGHCGVYLTPDHHHGERSEYSSCAWHASTSQGTSNTLAGAKAFTFAFVDALCFAFTFAFADALCFAFTFADDLSFTFVDALTFAFADTLCFAFADTFTIT